ncbi:hypothetical protein CCHL11_02486 [Colletotrichum chlorophyti]|uniref:Uncharacterized protein n=1 Tax=Colletotrichum chlorophyti TaxID=708187 RepID=A0A1Q8S8S6_9PEZI|nr:hypothetical protein CCHL11_02486 [Colletotrichum chlorophyti]
MSGRRDRGTTVITPEERIRRVQEAKANIRVTATYTPALLGRIESRIEANAFRRCISDNTIYQSLCNSLKDKNLSARDRRPDLVDFLALEAIIPVNYDGEYNRVLKDLFIQCHTEAWVDKAVLQANHEWFADNLGEARSFIKDLINKVDSQLLEIILEDVETSFWREDIEEHALYARVCEKINSGKDLSQRDVLTVVAINGGRYPTKIFRHLVMDQDSAMLHYGSNIHAQHALYEDEEFQGSRGNSSLYSDTMTNLDGLVEAMNSGHNRVEARKKIRELKEMMGKDSGILRATMGGRIRKVCGGSSAGQRGRPAPTGNQMLHKPMSSPTPGLFVSEDVIGYGGYGGYHGGVQGQLEGDDGLRKSKVLDFTKREDTPKVEHPFLDRSDSLPRVL